MDLQTDGAAIRRSLDEPRAFTAVFDRHFDAVHRYASRRVGRDLADDIAAETFTRAFDRRRGYDVEYEDARPWLLGIATNLMRRHWRAERRRLDAVGRAGAEPTAAGVDAALESDVVAAVRAMPRRDRETLLLFAWAELSYEEIAVALDVPVGTVRSRLARARRLVRRQLGEERRRAFLESRLAKEPFHA